MKKTNADKLAQLSVIGEIASPTLKVSYRIHPILGEPVQLPSVGGISYNANLGDSAIDLAADHIEPGVSIRNAHDASNRALNTFACIGNRARVLTGEGKGMVGWVTGKHGGVDHVMIHFPELDELDRLAIGDRIQVRSFGTGFKLQDYPAITVMNLDPAVYEKMNERSQMGSFVQIPVTHHVPAQLLGAGLGEDSCQVGDVDIQLFDAESVEEYNLNTLRFGDFIAMMDCDHRYGRIYRKGWVSIGVVVHSACIQAGHGPGVTTLFTGPASTLQTVTDPEANLKNVLPELAGQQAPKTPGIK